MSASCCGGQWDLFLQDYIHKGGCPKRQVGSCQQAAQERLDAGRDSAFGARSGSLAGDPSYELGRKLEEDARVKRQLDEAGFPIGGRRQRGTLDYK